MPNGNWRRPMLRTAIALAPRHRGGVAGHLLQRGLHLLDGDGGRRSRRDHDPHGQLVGQPLGGTERQREIVDAGAVRAPTGHEPACVGLPQQSVEVVEVELDDLLLLETRQAGIERCPCVLETSHDCLVQPLVSGGSVRNRAIRDVAHANQAYHPAGQGVRTSRAERTGVGDMSTSDADQSTMMGAPEVRGRVEDSSYAETSRRERAGTGWITFAAVMLMILGAFHFIAGLTALFKDEYYLVTDNDLVVSVNYDAWGWVHLAMGALIVLAGLSLFSGHMYGRIAAVVVASRARSTTSPSYPHTPSGRPS